MDNDAYGVQGRTTEEVMQEAQLTDVSTQRNYMAVMSNSMSDEDYARLLKEGGNPNDTDIDTVVTIVDRIKAELVKSGVHVAGYTDDLDPETLTKIVGSESLANHLRDAFTQNDIPVTEENVKTAMAALSEAGQLSPLEDGELKYQVVNGQEPTIENLYFAKHAGAVDADRQSAGYYQESYGYYAKKAETPDFQKLLPQIEKVIREAGLEVNDTTTREAEWLVEKGIPLTADSLQLLHRQKQIQLPIDDNWAVECVSAAMAEGKDPLQADLTENRSRYAKAADIAAYVDQLLTDDTVSLQARRKLEEVRLRMTAEVNVRLIDSGFSIDTADMESLIQALKEAEEKQAQQMFPGQDQMQAMENLDLYLETGRQTAQLYNVPSAVLGRVLFDFKQTVNVEHLVTEGSRLKTQMDMENALLSYETLLTEPRRDLGDSMKKAFANVDDILVDLGYEKTYENERAVRILAYNRIDIIPENLERVREADRRVNRVIHKMTPAATLQMIRDGINPITTEMEDLEQYFDGQDSQPEKEMETYSRYLYGLEKNKDITPEEREAYIGVYRMLRQIEKSDGAVIGSVLKSHSELNFRQLLTAARTAKRAGMNILVDESFGELKEVIQAGRNIDEQLDFIEKQWIHEEAEETRQRAGSLSEKVSEQTLIDTLNRLELPATFSYMETLAVMSDSANPLFDYLRKQSDHEAKPTDGNAASGKTAGEESLLEESVQEGTAPETAGADFLETWTQNFREAMQDSKTMQKAYESFSDAVTKQLQEVMYREDQTSVDIKAIRAASLQMHVASRYAEEETYDIPAELESGLTAIRLTIRHKEGQWGQADVTLSTEALGKVQIFLQVDQTAVSGYMTAEHAAGLAGEKQKALENDLRTQLSKQQLSLGSFSLIEGDAKGMKEMAPGRKEIVSGTTEMSSGTTEMSSGTREIGSGTEEATGRENSRDRVSAHVIYRASRVFLDEICKRI